MGAPLAAVKPEPMRDPSATTEEYLREVTVGEPIRLDGTIALIDYDPAWPAQFAREASRIRERWGNGLSGFEHIGSTSVPGLLGKPIIDVLLVVADSANEPSYLPDLEAAGYVLRIREPGTGTNIGSSRAPTSQSICTFFPSGRPKSTEFWRFETGYARTKRIGQLYARTKQRLAAQKWTYTQNYADAKSEVIRGDSRPGPGLPPIRLARRRPAHL